MKNRYFLLGLAFLFIIGCNRKEKGKQEKASSTESQSLEIKYAKGFGISRSDDEVILRLHSPFQDSDDTITYHLTFGAPKRPAHDHLIQLPLKRVALMSSAHASFLDELNSTSTVKAISNKSYFYNTSINELVNLDSVREVGYGQNIDFENTLIINPQLLIISGMSSNELLNYSKLSEAGIQILPISEWREEHPLGRAEWIKVFGALTGRLDKSIEIFSEVEKKYLELASLVKDVPSKPKVIVNAPYKDIWWLPGGNSYMSTFLSHAGANYPWSDDPNTGGIQADLESVFFKASDADFWINPSGFTKLDDIVSIDERFKEFSAFRNKDVYNNTLRIAESGGNDYFEKGIARPNLVLKDLIKIFHPELIEDDNFYFYQKLN